MGDRIEIATLDGAAAMPAYRAMPEGSPKGAIVVIQEIFGINAGIREKADRWATLGYLAIAPDLFWRMEPGVELDPDVPAEMERAFDFYKRFDLDAAMRDVEATIKAARGDAEKVGVVGYCLGGLIAYLAATRTDADASVGYYGGGIDTKLSEAHAIGKPLMLHFAGDDHFIDAAARAAIGDGLGSNSRVTIHDYAGVDHGFAATSGSRRVDDAARLADGRTEAFFAEHIG
ncbi:dienelactone hydrolase family protein [Sphingomonas montana]|uniref:dienelactone hydrolase family protein n=1 Tax=Sphingomonas montana TaxID=1843236 RepID=UPI00096EEB96|nr:dienelactone hydrolase family protein [Sphingomonas montana]